MTTEQKHEIDIPGLPEGYRAVAYRIPNFGEYYVDSSEKITEYRGGHGFKKLIVEKIQPRRIVLEEKKAKYKERYDDAIEEIQELEQSPYFVRDEE